MLISVNPLRRLTAKLCAVGAGFKKPFPVRQAETALVGHHIICAMSQGKTDFVVLSRQMLTFMLILRRRGYILIKTPLILLLFREVEAEFHFSTVLLCSFKTAVDI